ncbi:hypothetical protein FKV24_008050 [Lysobacter maris]|uniref:Uncharacterized protein n=1 Tax=Marilutibacter maris TaxID=1605891 RepID=A0A508AQP9_9GAMM|nr:hypothetical protein [Lysobacter maris]KAB8191351.1 hypothetical protein FKV24_008050 [Lysobacter maris]
MKKLLKNARQSGISLRNKLRNAVIGASVAMTAVPGLAFATGTDPAAAITAELSGIKDNVGGILVVLASVVGLMLLWAYIKRAK